MKCFPAILFFILVNIFQLKAQPGFTAAHCLNLQKSFDKTNVDTHFGKLLETRNLKKMLLHPEQIPQAGKDAKMPLVFCASRLPFFCKIEHQMEKASGLPVKFRLGEVQQVEAKEGK